MTVLRRSDRASRSVPVCSRQFTPSYSSLDPIREHVSYRWKRYPPSLCLCERVDGPADDDDDSSPDIINVDRGDVASCGLTMVTESL